MPTASPLESRSRLVAALQNLRRRRGSGLCSSDRGKEELPPC